MLVQTSEVGGLRQTRGRFMFEVSMKPLVNLEETPGKTVGRRRPFSNTLELTEAQRTKESMAIRQVFGGLRIPKGVYRFSTHEEADEWLWRMMTRPNR